MDIALGLAPLMGLLWLGLGALTIALFAFWVWMLVDCLLRDFHDSTTKLIWAIVIIFVHFIGAVIYLLVGRAQGTLPGRGAVGS